MKKAYVLDTNVLLTDPKSIFSFEEHDVILPFVVLEELDRFKTRQDELGANAREVSRQLSLLIKASTNSLKTGIKLPQGGNIIAIPTDGSCAKLPEGISTDKNDNLILAVCMGQPNAILVTNDIILRVIADACGIKAEEYKKHSVASSLDGIYTGLRKVNVEKHHLAELWRKSEINGDVNDEIHSLAPELLPNEFVHVTSSDSSKSFTVRSSENGVKFVPETYELPKVKPRNLEQRLALDLLMDPKINLVTIVGKAGTGKASPVDTPTLTPDGWKQMGKIKPGDSVISVDGNPTKVLATFPQGLKRVYKIMFSDGTSVECCKEHLWETKTFLERKQGKPGRVRSTEEIMKTLSHGKNGKRNHSIPMVSPVKFTEKKVPVDPYILGVILGCGSLSAKVIQFSTKNMETIAKVQEKLDRIGVSLKEKKVRHGHCFSVTKKDEKKNLANLIRKLSQLNLLGCEQKNKFIPKSYKYNSINTRLSVLQGIMDAAGTVTQNGKSALFASSSKWLANDIQELVWSFGGQAIITKETPLHSNNNAKEGSGLLYTVEISMPEDVCPFSVGQKVLTYRRKTKRPPVRYIVDVIPGDEKECVCLLVEHPRHLYVTKDYIVTHNTLLALAAGLEQVVDKRKYKSLVVLRPVQPLGKDIGYLPGPQPLDAKIATPNGWTRMGDLSVGDLVIARNGLPTKVIGVFPKGKKAIYRITTTDGTSTEACEDHLWFTQTTEEQKRKNGGSIKTTKQIAQTLKTKNGKNNHFLPRNEPVHYEQSQTLPISPYTLGCLLGSTNFSSFTMTSFKDEKSLLKKQLEKLGLDITRSDAKFIPEAYKYSSVQSRISLLQGLMDVAGSIKKNGKVTFVTKSKQLGEDVVNLVRSLGGKIKVYSHKHNKRSNTFASSNKSSLVKNTSYSFGISLPKGINPFFTNEKATKYQYKHLDPIGISSIEYVGEKEAQCILIDNEEHLYITDEFIVTHNTKEEKMEPWIAPIKDNLRFLLTSDNGRKSKISENSLNHYFERGIIEVEALTYIRGRSISEAFMIIDEAQNLSAHELKTIITRVGDGTKIILTGDVEQIDNMYVDSVSNGLAVAVERFKKHSIAGHITLTKGERSELATLATRVL